MKSLWKVFLCSLNHIFDSAVQLRVVLVANFDILVVNVIGVLCHEVAVSEDIWKPFQRRCWKLVGL